MIDYVERADAARGRLETTLHSLALARLQHLRKEWRTRYPKRSLMVAWSHNLPILEIDGRYTYLDLTTRKAQIGRAGSGRGRVSDYVYKGGSSWIGGPMLDMLADAIEEVHEIVGEFVEPQGFNMVVKGRRYTVEYC